MGYPMTCDEEENWHHTPPCDGCAQQSVQNISKQKTIETFLPLKGKSIIRTLRNIPVQY